MDSPMKRGVGRGRGIFRGLHLNSEDTPTPESLRKDNSKAGLSYKETHSKPKGSSSSQSHVSEDMRQISVPGHSGSTSTGDGREDIKETLSIPTRSPSRVSDLSESSAIHSSQVQGTHSRPPGPLQKVANVPVPVACVFPIYFKSSGPSKRVLRMKRCPVKIVNVIDKNGKVDVVFEDSKSKKLFTHLSDQMSRFYSTAEGFGLLKPMKYLRTGEIVAASVSKSRKPFRRVKITADGAVDIDDLEPCYLISAFSLIEEFYRHPTQACTLKISNFHDLYPKDVFEIFFNQYREDFDAVMLELSVNVLRSLGGQTFMVSNLKIMDEGGQEILTGKLDLTYTPGYRSVFGEAFCERFIPKIPEVGEPLIGHVTDIDMNGDIRICSTSSLFQSIDRIINEADIVQRSSKTKEHQKELSKKVANYHAAFLAVDNNDESRLYRIKILAFNHEKDTIKAFFMDKAKNVFMSLDNLVCSLFDSSSFPSMLSLIPPQAIRYHLAGVDLCIAQTECDNILGKKVRFQVVHRSPLKYILPEIKIQIIPD